MSVQFFARFSKSNAVLSLSWVVVDAAIVATTALLSALLRYDFLADRALTRDTALFAVEATAAFLVLNLALGPWSDRSERGSFEETVGLVRVIAPLTAGLTALVLLAEPGVPRSLPLVAPALALVGMFSVRFFVRSYRWGGRAGTSGQVPVVVYGAGAGARQLIRALIRDQDPELPLVPVAVIDDDRAKRRTRIEHLRVRGTGADLAAIVEETGAKTLVLAIPSLSSERLLEIQRQARDLGLELLSLPPISQLLGAPGRSDLRRLRLEDFLGRRQITLDESRIHVSITGKRVLVTGAGGSIGAELCRQIAHFDPARLILLDRDESALHGTQMMLTGRALLDDGTLTLADIRDRDSLRTIFDREKPEVVFHAAALKHLTLLEQFPVEAWKSNVLGTRNVLEAARASGVRTFVNISTDKAADPTCVLGYSKRVAERLTADYARRGSGTFVSVRFGNVLGSRGSVMTSFTAQIERGGPVTVTDPNVERFFMLIPEACQLVLQAAAIGQNGDVMVLDMGRPMKIVDIARTLIDLSGKPDIRIEYTGLRPGEKMSEVLFSGGEPAVPSAHPLVSRVSVPPLDQARLDGVCVNDERRVRAWMSARARSAVQTAPIVLPVSQADHLAAWGPHALVSVGDRKELA